MLERVRHFGTWVMWFIHAPMSAFWMVTAIIAIVGTITIVKGTASVGEVASAILVMVGVTHIVARAKGVHPWPVRRRAGDSTETARPT